MLYPRVVYRPNAPAVPVPAAVGEWDARSYTTNFDPSLADPWTDETGNGYTLTRSDEVNMRVYEDHFGTGAHAVRHWGSMQRTDAGLTPTLSGPFTVAMYMEYANYFFTASAFAANKDGTPAQQIYLGNDGGVWRFYWNQNGTQEVHITTQASEALGDDFTMVCTIDPDARRMTLSVNDGTLQDHTFTTGVGSTWDPDRFATGGVNPFIGWCKLWDNDDAADDAALRSAIHAEMLTYIP